MKIKDYKKHIEALAKMNNPPVSQCIALLRQLYGKLDCKPEIIYEADCPACGEIVEFENIGWKICPHCKGAKAIFDVNWEIIEDKDNG